MISSSLASNESGTLVIEEGGDDVEDSEPPDVAESNDSGTLVIEEGGDEDDDSEPPMDSSEDSRSARFSSGMLSDIPESENYGSRSQSKAKSLLL